MLNCIFLLFFICWAPLVGVENQSLITNFECEEAAQLKNLEHRKGKYSPFLCVSLQLGWIWVGGPHSRAVIQRILHTDKIRKAKNKYS